MKKIILLSLIFAGFIGDSVAATRPTGRNNRATSGTQTTENNSGTTAVSARAATNSRAAPRATTGVAARSAVRGTAARSAAPVAPKSVVAARAATTQKVVQSGTKVSTAAKNIVVSEECQAKWDGCMDAFCMLDNTSGGRCLCSNRNKELDSILAEIEKLDQQSYQMATLGVEKIEMGDDAAGAIAQANAVADSILNGEKSNKRSLNLDIWSVAEDEEDDEMGLFSMGDMLPSSADTIEGKEGDALYVAAAGLCTQQMPECSSDFNMLKLMYSQRIKSDCEAYENSLKKSKIASQQKLSAAEQALRSAALEQYQNANKYDLGQCTIEFRKCMQTTGGCGEDFAGCASMIAMDKTNTTKSSNNAKKSYKIKGEVTQIEIAASTYDALMAKKPLCESVTKSCARVADQVWDKFLAVIAPTVKSAELIAENNVRQSCIGNISDCFQKACRDNIDPNDKDGSYDMCLSNPAAMLNVCKIPLNACGIDATSENTAEKSDIWEFVLARLSAMRVDACTNEVKDCLTADDRCGNNYTNCIGLDTDTIVRMCPFEKLTACADRYEHDNDNEENKDENYDPNATLEDKVYDYVANIAQGIFLNIDNNFMSECQNAADEAMIRVCGDTENCDSLTTDEGIGARSLEYKICEYNATTEAYTNCRSDVRQIQDNELGLGLDENGENNIPKTFASKIEGQIPWEKISFIDDEGKDFVRNYNGTTVKDLFGDNAPEEDEVLNKIASELNVLKRNVEAAVTAIESDPTVQYCMTGRQVQGMRVKGEGSEHRTYTTAVSGDEDVIEIGRKSGRFPKLTQQMRGIIATSALKIAKDNYMSKIDEFNQQKAQDYVKIGERIAKNMKENALEARRESARVACINLAEGGAMPTPRLFKGQSFDLKDAKLTGSKSTENPQYKETVTTTFMWETLVCKKCIRSQGCAKFKRKVLDKNSYCKEWEDVKESCEDVQF